MVYYMVDLVASNEKLKQRSHNILKQGSLGCNAMSGQYLDDLITRCDRSVKLALLVADTELSVEQCKSHLEPADGVLEVALADTMGASREGKSGAQGINGESLVLRIDGGGTKCAAAIADGVGDILGRGIAGPCNLYVFLGPSMTMS
ncbi:hypothetical protein BBP40_000328 [Aspergillus hancockii]|nr:hypothetical protein BBP40_000328 [Aspergillus hancockii]